MRDATPSAEAMQGLASAHLPGSGEIREMTIQTPRHGRSLLAYTEERTQERPRDQARQRDGVIELVGIGGKASEGLGALGTPGRQEARVDRVLAGAPRP